MKKEISSKINEQKYPILINQNQIKKNHLLTSDQTYFLFSLQLLAENCVFFYSFQNFLKLKVVDSLFYIQKSRNIKPQITENIVYQKSAPDGIIINLQPGFTPTVFSDPALPFVYQVRENSTLEVSQRSSALCNRDCWTWLLPLLLC